MSSSAISLSVFAATIRIWAFSLAVAFFTASTYLLPAVAESSSTLQTYITGLLVRRNSSRANFCSSLPSMFTVRAGSPCSRASLYAWSTVSCILAVLSAPALAAFSVLARRESIVSRSLIWSS